MSLTPAQPTEGAGPPAGEPHADVRRRSMPSRRLTRIAMILVAGYALVVLLMVFLENKLIFMPSVYPAGDWNPPGLEYEDAWFEADDGTKLHGWFLPHAEPRAIVLFAHGNAGNVTDRGEILDALVNRLGATVLIFDYRGYGRSLGSPSEEGVLADARAARRELARRAGVAESQIVLFGESLGAGVMVDLAARDGARALVLDSTFSSLPDVAAYHYPWLPAKLLMRTRLDSAAKIGNYRGPLLQLHGENDTIIPLSLGKRLFRAANEPKELVVLQGLDHNDPRPPEFFRAIDRFLGEVGSKKSAPPG